MNINKFLSELNKGGIVKPSNFDVVLTPPLSIKNTTVEESIKFRCQSVDLPGRSAQTVDHSNYGLTRKYSNGSLMNDINLSIILDEKLHIKEYLENWIDLAVGKYRKTRSDSMFDTGFYDDYVGTLLINQYNEKDELISETTLLEAYPIMLGNESLSWASGGEILTLPVTFTYYYYEHK